MPELQSFPLRTTSGLAGRVYRASRFLDRNELNPVRLDDGTEWEVPSTALQVQPNGEFLMDDSLLHERTMRRPQAATPPPAAAQHVEHESAPAAAGPANGGARTYHAPAESRPEVKPAPSEVVIDQPLFSEDVSLERVAVNRLIDEPVPVRQEGEVTIIPVLEEVITVQKRLLLKEEVRITRRRTEVREPRRVVVDGAAPRLIGSDGRDIQVH